MIKYIYLTKDKNKTILLPDNMYGCVKKKKKNVCKAVGRSRVCSGDRTMECIVARKNDDVFYEEAWG